MPQGHSCASKIATRLLWFSLTVLARKCAQELPDAIVSVGSSGLPVSMRTVPSGTVMTRRPFGMLLASVWATVRERRVGCLADHAADAELQRGNCGHEGREQLSVNRLIGHEGGAEAGLAGLRVGSRAREHERGGEEGCRREPAEQCFHGVPPDMNDLVTSAAESRAAGS